MLAWFVWTFPRIPSISDGPSTKSETISHYFTTISTGIVSQKKHWDIYLTYSIQYVPAHRTGCSQGLQVWVSPHIISNQVGWYYYLFGTRASPNRRLLSFICQVCVIFHDIPNVHVLVSLSMLVPGTKHGPCMCSGHPTIMTGIPKWTYVGNSSHFKMGG